MPGFEALLEGLNLEKIIGDKIKDLTVEKVLELARNSHVKFSYDDLLERAAGDRLIAGERARSEARSAFDFERQMQAYLVHLGDINTVFDAGDAANKNWLGAAEAFGAVRRERSDFVAEGGNPTDEAVSRYVKAIQTPFTFVEEQDKRFRRLGTAKDYLPLVKNWAEYAEPANPGAGSQISDSNAESIASEIAKAMKSGETEKLSQSAQDTLELEELKTRLKNLYFGLRDFKQPGRLINKFYRKDAGRAIIEGESLQKELQEKLDFLLKRRDKLLRSQTVGDADDDETGGGSEVAGLRPSGGRPWRPEDAYWDYKSAPTYDRARFPQGVKDASLQKDLSPVAEMRFGNSLGGGTNSGGGSKLSLGAATESESKSLDKFKELAPSAISAAESVAGAVIKNEQAKAGVLALMETAQAIVAGVSGNVPGAIAHGAAAALYTSVALGGGSSSAPAVGGTPSSGGGGGANQSGTPQVVNVFYGVLGTPQQVGLAAQKAISATKGTGFSGAGV